MFKIFIQWILVHWLVLSGALFKIFIQWILAHWLVLSGALVTIYEAIVRMVPTVGNWSLLAKIIQFLKWLSDVLNNKKQT